ncbi:MAG: hypothetical protein IPK60_07355 [Sandaracinaceae bacterium]|jgi:hypothetical protein|nr:hypothetical protein [Sandaracinaceae bacterium]
MSRSFLCIHTVVLVSSLVALTGCAERTLRGLPTDGGGSTTDFGNDGGMGYDLAPVNACAPGCGPTELCGETGDGNGLDDNCNGSVDEGCICAAAGTTRPCFLGPPDRRDVGSCSDGVESCGEFLSWGDCVGGTSPSEEVCDGADNDCDAITDNGLSGCTSGVTCPASQNAAPLATYPLRGDLVYGAPGSNWHWDVQCSDGFSGTCPAPTNPDARDSSIYFVSSGAYRVTVTFTTDEGEPGSCAFTVYVQGSGLRVELNWDTVAQGTDVDLHLHRWTSNSNEADWFDQVDDCYYGNCTPSDFSSGEPGLWLPEHAESSVDQCATAPHGGGALWRSRGSCANPRLDIDTNGLAGQCDPSDTDPNSGSFCAPENINVDNPVIGKPYRIMVNYFNDNGVRGRTGPIVNIFCGGAPRATFGADPFVFLVNGEGAGASNDNWLVADVVFYNGECGPDCRIYPIASSTVRGDPDLAFGPPWSCNYDAASESCIEP